MSGSRRSTRATAGGNCAAAATARVPLCASSARKPRSRSRSAVVRSSAGSSSTTSTRSGSVEERIEHTGEMVDLERLAHRADHSLLVGLLGHLAEQAVISAAQYDRGGG